MATILANFSNDQTAPGKAEFQRLQHKLQIRNLVKKAVLSWQNAGLKVDTPFVIGPSAQQSRVPYLGVAGPLVPLVAAWRHWNSLPIDGAHSVLLFFSCVTVRLVLLSF